MPKTQTGDRWISTRPLLRRLLAYRDWLRAGRAFTAGQAAKELGVSMRTVYRDLLYMQTLGWDVEFCRARRCWRLASGELPLPLVTLREGEVVALLVAEQALHCYEGTPYAAALRSAFDKITALLDAPVTLDLTQAPLPRFMGPPARPVEARQYERLYDCCQRRRQVEIDYYVPDRDELTRRVIDPYHLFAYGGDWYVAAFDHLRGEWRTFALGERLRAMHELGLAYEPDPGFDLDRYLAEGFGLFRGGPVEEVVLRFSPAVARYMRERVWDETESKENLPDGGLLLRMRVPVNVGLLRFVLQYGAEVEVLAPKSLRADVTRITHEAARLYAYREGPG
jgi:predicted DNA-binding transcriptional regulator YafY